MWWYQTTVRIDQLWSVGLATSAWVVMVMNSFFVGWLVGKYWIWNVMCAFKAGNVLKKGWTTWMLDVVSSSLLKLVQNYIWGCFQKTSLLTLYIITALLHRLSIEISNLFLLHPVLAPTSPHTSRRSPHRSRHGVWRPWPYEPRERRGDWLVEMMMKPEASWKGFSPLLGGWAPRTWICG